MHRKARTILGGGLDLSLPTGDFGTYFKTGIGGYVKAMLGVGKVGAVTFTTGYSSFKEAGDWEDFTATQGVAPLLFGYRHNFNGFFVEPQIGYGIYNYKETSQRTVSTQRAEVHLRGQQVWDMYSTIKLK